LPAQVAFRWSTVRAAVAETKRPTRDQTASEPVLLYALKVPSAAIARLEVGGLNPTIRLAVTPG
jgi:hypothetical protein